MLRSLIISACSKICAYTCIVFWGTTCCCVCFKGHIFICPRLHHLYGNTSSGADTAEKKQRQICSFVNAYFRVCGNTEAECSGRGPQTHPRRVRVASAPRLWKQALNKKELSTAGSAPAPAHRLRPSIYAHGGPPAGWLYHVCWERQITLP